MAGVSATAVLEGKGTVVAKGDRTSYGSVAPAARLEAVYIIPDRAQIIREMFPGAAPETLRAVLAWQRRVVEGNITSDRDVALLTRSCSRDSRAPTSTPTPSATLAASRRHRSFS
jgi:hypothetical protein